MLRLLTARNYFLMDALLRETGAALKESDRALLVVVPKQLTLETERALIAGLNLRGSFRLQVLSPERLCQKIFDAAGWPEGVRIDDRGRVMLVRRALLRLKDDLTLYRGAHNRLGFAERAAKQLEAFRQAGLTPECILEIAAEQSGTLKRKLVDFSALLRAYEESLAGRYQDGESEFFEAGMRAKNAPFLQESEIWVYGFDMMPPSMHNLWGAISAACARLSVFLPLETDENAPDADLFLPLRQSAARLILCARENNAAVERVRLIEKDARSDVLRHLENALYSPACPEYKKESGRAVTLFEAKNPLEEARLAAAYIRGVVSRDSTMRYRDVRILCRDISLYAQPLTEAFRACEIPLVLSASRAASRHALCECLLSALAAIEKNFRREDIVSLLSSGYLEVSKDAADRLCNYIEQYNLRGSAVLRPLARGHSALLEALSPVHLRAFAPVKTLRDALRKADSLFAQLNALYGFLTEINAYEKSLARQKALVDAGLFALAGEEAQVWNRILGTFDQMHALMGPDKLAISMLRRTLAESLDAAVVKSLPQSDDAVYAQDTSSASMCPVRIILVLGATDQAVSAQDGLFTQAQLYAVSTSANRFIALSAQEASRARLLAEKSAIGMAVERLYVSYPLCGTDGSAQRPGILARQLQQIFPGILPDAQARKKMTARLLLNAPMSACREIALGLSAGELSPLQLDALSAVCALPGARDALSRLRLSLDRHAALDSLNPETARALFGKISKASISRLERFAACPFSHFAQYGLKPEIFEPFELTPRDAGKFFHDAVCAFISTCKDEHGAFDPETAETRMDEISQVLLAQLRENQLSISATARAEERRLKAIVRTAARALSEQLLSSSFRPVGLEISFGKDDAPNIFVGKDLDCDLEGRTDRIDLWNAPDGARFLRVIDYKSGKTKLSAAEAYFGVQLQLLLYLAAATKREKSRPAGVFYFRLEEGILETPETDPALVAVARQKAMRLEGLPPRDPAVLQAMAEDFTSVLNVRAAKDGALPAGTGAQERDFENLILHAIRRAGEHVANIRKGEAAVSPVRGSETNPCQYCDWKSACLFDPLADAARVRKIPKMTFAELLSKLNDR